MTVLSWLLQNAVIAAVAAGALALLFRFRRPRPAVEHLLWLAITVKLVLPPIAPLPLPVAVVERLRVVGLLGTSRRAAPPRDDGRTLPATLVEARTHDAPSSPLMGSELVSARRDAGIPVSRWILWFGAVWGGGAMLSATRMLLRYLRFRRRLGIEEATCELRALVTSVAAEVGIVPPRIVMSKHITTPVVLGLVRPSLIWPLGLHLPAVRMRVVVAHELAHIRRRDLWLGPLELLIGSIWWWYPVWWLVRRRLRDAAERACDAAVLNWYPQHRRAYAEALLDVLSLELRPQPAFGLGVDGPGRVRLRLERILRSSPAERSRTSYATIAMTTLALTPVWTIPLGHTQSAARETVPARDAAVVKHGIIGIASRGVVRFTGKALLPELEPGGWLVAFAGAAAGPIRRLELRRSDDGEAARVRYRIGERVAPVDADVVAWLRGIMRRSSYDPKTTRAQRSATAAWVPDGPHMHRTDGLEVLGLWSTTAHPFGGDGTLDGAVDRDHPLFMVYQAASADPVVVLTLASSAKGVGVLDASIDAAPIDSASDAAFLARHLLRRAAEWATPRTDAGKTESYK